MHNTRPESGALSRSNGGPHARPTRTSIGVIALVTVLALVTPTGAEPEMEVVGTWGGEVRALFIDPASPDIAYVGSGRNLVILDVADADDIRELGRIDLGNLLYDIQVRDGYAYVCTFWQPNYFCVVDVSDLSSPELVWSWNDDTSMKPKEVDLYGDVAFVRAGVDVEAFDISDPTSPVRLARVVFSIAADCEIVGDRMYMVDDFKHVRIYDLAAPWLPTVVDHARLQLAGIVTLPGNQESGTAIDVEGSYAYAVTRSGNGILAVVDVTEPTTPQVVGSYESCDGRDVAVADGVAYFVDCGELTVLDAATSPDEPSPIGGFATHGAIQYVHIVGPRAYVLDQGEGLIIFDIAGRSDPVRLGNWHSPKDLRRMDKVGDLLYVTDALNGFSTIDVSEAADPALIGVYQTGEDSGRWGDNWGIEVHDQTAYLAAGAGGLEMVDVGVPTTPAMLGAFRVPDGFWAYGITVRDHVAHVGIQKIVGGLLVNFDVSDPNNISDIGFADMGSGPVTIDIDDSNGIAFTARYGSGGSLTNINTDNPNAPVIIADHWPGGVDLARADDIVYLANEDSINGGIYAVDVSVPSAPEQDPNDVWQLPEGGNKGTVGVSLIGKYVLATAQQQNAVYIIDFSDTDEPVTVAQMFVPNPQTILIDGGYAYVTCLSQGLAVIAIRTVGDLNCDGSIDFDDIDPFVAALSGEAGYRAAYANCHWRNGDCNGDGEINFDDIDAFVGLLAGH